MGRANASITRPFQDSSGRSVRAWIIRARAPMAARCASSKGRTRIELAVDADCFGDLAAQFRLDRNPIAKLYEFRSPAMRMWLAVSSTTLPQMLIGGSRVALSTRSAKALSVFRPPSPGEISSSVIGLARKSNQAPSVWMAFLRLLSVACSVVLTPSNALCT